MVFASPVESDLTRFVVRREVERTPSDHLYSDAALWQYGNCHCSEKSDKFLSPRVRKVVCHV